MKLCVLLIGGAASAFSLLAPACAPRPEPASAAAQTPRARAAPTPKPADGNDRRVLPEPALPALPAAGGTFRDPVFGTEVMRVTDARDGKLNGTFYPHWPTLNADSTRLLVKRYETGDAVYSFDPVNFKLGASRPLPRLPDNGVLITEGAIWSATDPDVLYGPTFNGPYIWALDVSTNSYKLFKDFRRERGFGPKDYLWQMSMSADGDTFAFTHKNGSYKTIGYGAYRRSDDRVLLLEAGDAADEVRVDKSGRYLIAYLARPDARGNDTYVHDLTKGTAVGLKPGAPDYTLSHGDVGTGFLLGWDNDENRFLRRELSDPRPFKLVLAMGADWLNQHVSLLARDETWALLSFYSYRGAGGSGPGLFHDELVLVRTDGSGRFRRILQHRSKAQEYWETPRANLSYDGRFVAFSSNWGGSKRTDLFIARLDPPLGAGAPQTPAQPPAPARQRPRRAGSN